MYCKCSFDYGWSSQEFANLLGRMITSKSGFVTQMKLPYFEIFLWAVDDEF